MKSILILAASEMHLPIIRECRRLGHRVLVADADGSAPGLLLADVPLLISTNDVEAILAAAREHAIDGILTTSDYPVRTVARVCAELGLPGPSQEAAAICTDKFQQRRLLRSRNLPCPDFVLVESEAQLQETERLAFPVIVKPVDSSASRGVSRVDRSAGLPEAYSLARSYSRSGNVLVEEFIAGPEFSVEVLIQHGVVHIVAITEKTTGGDAERFYVETRHVVPAELSPGETALIHESVRRTLEAAGLDNSASHTEIKLSPSGPVIVEIAARLGGDYITSDLVPLATGVSMLENAIRISLGEEIDPVPKLANCAGIQFVTPQDYECAKQKFQQLRADRRIHRMELRPSPNGAALQSSLDRLGYCIASARQRDELFELLHFRKREAPVC